MSNNRMKLLTVLSLTAPAMLFATTSSALAWSADDAHLPAKSTHLFIASNAVEIMKHSADPSIKLAGDTMEQYRQDWEQGLYDADHMNPYYDSYTFTSHFYDPDTMTNYAGLSYPTARQAGSKYFKMAGDHYKMGNLQSAFYYLGVSLHFFTDLTQPMHAANFSNLNHGAPGYHSKFEEYATQIQSHAAVTSGLLTQHATNDPEQWLHLTAKESKSHFPEIYNSEIQGWFWDAAFSQWAADQWRAAVTVPTKQRLTAAQQHTAGFAYLWWQTYREGNL